MVCFYEGEKTISQLYVLRGPETGQSFELKDDGTYIGSSMENDIQLEDRAVSHFFDIPLGEPA
jgi:hypothetical protein